MPRQNITDLGKAKRHYSPVGKCLGSMGECTVEHLTPPPAALPSDPIEAGKNE